jgi:DNA polymerase-3 subunit delta
VTDFDLPELVLVSGPEQLLAQRAVDGVVATLRAHDPDVDVVRLAAGDYEAGDLGVHASPSLFGGWTAIVVEDFDEADDALVEDAHELAQTLPEGVTLIVRHKSGNRGKRVLDVLKKRGRVISAPALKSDRDKTAFVQQEFRDAGRRIEEPALTALVQAVGRDVAELASACAQLVRDTSGTVRAADVETYYGGKVETTGFKVADAALQGDVAEALRLLRHALAGGLDPVPIVAVLAMQLRQVGKVASAGRASATMLARDLGMAPWQVDQARRAAQGWDGVRLGRAIQAVAAADVEVKGGLRAGTAVARDPEYAVERAVLAVCRERNG